MIQDQCNRCKKYNTSECIQTINFNGCSCDSYEKKVRINLEKPSDNYLGESANEGNAVDIKESTEETSILTAEYLKANTEIGGWLSFFLFSICLGGLISAIYPIATFNPVEYGSTILAMSDVILGILLCVLAFYTLYSFCQRKTNAVFLGKLYIVMTFASNLLLLFAGDYESNGIGSLSQIVRSLFWGIIWFSFLNLSSRVNEVIPKGYRKTLSRDYYFTAVLVLFPLLFLGLGVGDILSNQKEQEASFIQQTELGPDEHTDGRIIFKTPTSFSCNKEEMTDPQITLFSLENDNIGSITICSDYDTDLSRTNFESYWTNWKDESTKGFQMNVENVDMKSFNEHLYWIKTVRYENSELVIYWRFILLFDKPSGKVCLVSSYDGGYDSYIDELLESIRF